MNGIGAALTADQRTVLVLNASGNASLLFDGSESVESQSAQLTSSEELSGSTVASDFFAQEDLAITVPVGIALYFLSILTFVGNAMVLNAIRTEKRLQTVSNMFIMSLAIADITVGIIVMPISSAYAIVGTWPFGYVVCQAWLSVDYTASTASILNLFILSLDRYWSITSPLKYLRKRTKKRALLMISVVWLISALWILPIIGWHHIEFGSTRQHPATVCEVEFTHNVGFKIMTAILNFYIPTMAMLYLYCRIFFEIKQRSKFEVGQCTIVGGRGADGGGGHKGGERGGGGNGHVVGAGSDSMSEDAKPHDNKHKRNESGGVSRTGSLLSCTYSEAQPTNNTAGPEVTLSEAEFHNLTLLAFYESSNPGNTQPTNVYGNTANLSGALSKDTTLLKYEGVKVNVEYVAEDENNPNAYHLYNNKLHRQDSANLSAAPATSLTRSASDLRHKHHRKCYRMASVPSQKSLDCSSAEQTRTEIIDTNKNIKSKKFKKFKRRKVSHRSKTKQMSTNYILNKEKKAAKQLGVIMGAFVACWLPYFVLFTVIAYCGDCVPTKAHIFTIWLGYFNSALNPFLYPLCNANFKRAFEKMLYRMWPPFCPGGGNITNDSYQSRQASVRMGTVNQRTIRCKGRPPGAGLNPEKETAPLQRLPS